MYCGVQRGRRMEVPTSCCLLDITNICYHSLVSPAGGLWEYYWTSFKLIFIILTMKIIIIPILEGCSNEIVYVRYLTHSSTLNWHSRKFHCSYFLMIKIFKNRQILKCNFIHKMCLSNFSHFLIFHVNVLYFILKSL